MTDTSVLALLERIGAVVTNSHVVYTSGRHGNNYVDMDALHPHVSEATAVYARLIEPFADVSIDVVAGPTVNGVVVSQWVAYHLSTQTAHPALAVYAEEQGVIGQRVFRRGYADLLSGKRVLVVADILRTGGTARKMITAVQAAGGKVIGMGAVCNRGGLTMAELGVARLHTLVDVSMESWDEKECPLCRAGVPINTHVGKGAAFLARSQAD